MDPKGFKRGLRVFLRVKKETVRFGLTQRHLAVKGSRWLLMGPERFRRRLKYWKWIRKKIYLKTRIPRKVSHCE
jgi:hypothetical protein